MFCSVNLGQPPRGLSLAPRRAFFFSSCRARRPPEDRGCFSYPRTRLGSSTSARGWGWSAEEGRGVVVNQSALARGLLAGKIFKKYAVQALDRGSFVLFFGGGTLASSSSACTLSERIFLTICTARRRGWNAWSRSVSLLTFDTHKNTQVKSAGVRSVDGGVNLSLYKSTEGVKCRVLFFPQCK